MVGAARARRRRVFVRLLRRCLQKDPAKRLATLAEARQDIEATLASPFKLPRAMAESVALAPVSPLRARNAGRHRPRARGASPCIGAATTGSRCHNWPIPCR